MSKHLQGIIHLCNQTELYSYYISSHFLKKLVRIKIFQKLCKTPVLLNDFKIAKG